MLLARVLQFIIGRRRHLSSDIVKKVLKDTQNLVKKIAKSSAKEIEQAKRTLKAEARRQGKNIRL